MSTPKPGRRLFTRAEIAAAGAEAVKDWQLTDQVRDRLAALFAPTVGQVTSRDEAESDVPGRAA